MKIKPIKNNQDYSNALKRIENIFDAKPNTPQSDELEILGLLVDEYENKHFPIEATDPIEAIKIRMEELNLKQKDLVGIIGAKSKVSEVLNRKRKLTLEMVRNLSENLKISATVLINDYALVK